MDSLTGFLVSSAGSLAVAVLVATVVGAFKRRGEPLVESFFMDYFKRSSKPLHDKLEKLEKQVQVQSKEISGLSQDISTVRTGFHQQSEAIDGIRTGVVALDARVGRQSETIESVQQTVRGVKAQGAATDGKVDVLGAKVDDLDTKVGDLISLEAWGRRRTSTLSSEIWQTPRRGRS